IEKRIGRIEETRVHAARGARVLKVRFPEPPHCGETVLTVDGLRKTFGGPDIFHDVSFDLGRGERLLVLGLNGAGKTSLLRILAGEVKPDNGEVKFGYQVQVGYYAQEHDNLVPQRSLVEHMRDQAPVSLGLTETQLRGMLGMFGLSGDKVYQESATLSGGEKTKLALAMMMVGKNNLLFRNVAAQESELSKRGHRARRAREFLRCDRFVFRCCAPSLLCWLWRRIDRRHAAIFRFLCFVGSPSLLVEPRLPRVRLNIAYMCRDIRRSSLLSLRLVGQDATRE
ncbi:ABC transporter ATP-binding protein, partial [bacterium]|nr:ABC transporter ATP-binding protein [bacterium]